MNSFKGIKVDEGVVEEITNDNQLRNKKKKLRQLLSKLDSNGDKYSEKIKILRIMIEEYEDKNNPKESDNIEEKRRNNMKNQKKKKKKKENEFLEREYQKNKKYWEQERIRQERDEKEREERDRKERERKKRERKEERERYNRQREIDIEEPLSIDKICSDCDVEESDDLIELYNNYNKDLYRKLTLKYHPDKSNYHLGYIKALNQIKDKYNPIEVTYDNTWQK